MSKKVLHITISEEMKEELEKEAKEKQLSLNAYIRLILLGRKL